MEDYCNKCRTDNFDNCHSIHCPMRKELTIKSNLDLRKCFEELRIKNKSDTIVLTKDQQEEICKLADITFIYNKP